MKPPRLLSELLELAIAEVRDHPAYKLNMDVVKDGCQVCFAGLVLANHPEIFDGILPEKRFPALLKDGWKSGHLQSLNMCRCGDLRMAWGVFYNVELCDTPFFTRRHRWFGVIKDTGAFLADMEQTLHILKAKERELEATGITLGTTSARH